MVATLEPGNDGGGSSHPTRQIRLAKAELHSKADYLPSNGLREG
jgi:hypothetical protein